MNKLLFFSKAMLLGLMVTGCCEDEEASQLVMSYAQFPTQQQYIYEEQATGERDTLYALAGGVEERCADCSVICCDLCDDVAYTYFYDNDTIHPESAAHGPSTHSLLQFEASKDGNDEHLVEYLTVSYGSGSGYERYHEAMTFNFTGVIMQAVEIDNCQTSFEYLPSETFLGQATGATLRATKTCGNSTRFVKLSPGFAPLEYSLNDSTHFVLVDRQPL